MLISRKRETGSRIYCYEKLRGREYDFQRKYLTAILINMNDEEILANKLKELSYQMEAARKTNMKGNAYYHLRTNIMNFCKTLYFRLKWSDIFPAGRERIEACILGLHIEVYGEKC